VAELASDGGGGGGCSHERHQTKHGVLHFLFPFMLTKPRTVSITADIDIILVTIAYFIPVWYRAGESGFAFFPICIRTGSYPSGSGFYNHTLPSFLIQMFVFKNFTLNFLWRILSPRSTHTLD
jgi:hypothetical protein